MKILDVKNMADFLPNYKDHKIVLFEDNPEIVSQPHSLTTSANLWYHFDQDAMIDADLLTEKGGVTPDRAESVAIWLQKAIVEPAYWTTIESIYSVQNWTGANIGMFYSKDMLDSICILLPNIYMHPLMNFIRRGSGGFVWQTLPIESLNDDELFWGYSTEYFGLFDRDEQDILVDVVKEFQNQQR